MKDSSFFSKNIFAAAALASFLLVLGGCMSIPDEVPDDDREIIQLAQTAYDSGHTKVALFYYNALLEKFGDTPRVYVEGRFEIAHIYIKKKRYEQAVPILRELVELYNNVQPGILPGEYRKLAQKDLDKIPPKKMADIERKLAEKEAREAAEAERQAAEQAAAQAQAGEAAPEQDDGPEPEEAAAQPAGEDAEPSPNDAVQADGDGADADEAEPEEPAAQPADGGMEPGPDDAAPAVSSGANADETEETGGGVPSGADEDVPQED